MMANTFFILIPALPFAAFLLIALGGRLLGESSHRVAIPAVTGSFVLSVLACVDVYQHGARTIPLYTLIKSGALVIEPGFHVDAIAVLLLVLVTGVSSLVHVFASRYMQADPRYARFFALTALFTGAMVTLVMGSNLLMLFMFWEIMGLCSYLLISHWSRRPAACNAATKAFLVNGVADVGLAFGIYLTWATFGTLDIQSILAAAPAQAEQTVNLLGWLGVDWHVPVLSLIALLLFMGPIGKSAQLPLHVWLPFAMEAPTPVSALIHAATMVNAGVYLLIRMAPLYLLAPGIMTVVAVVGGTTAVFAAVVALTQFDVKRTLAYSTISQLGFMVLACGLGAYGAAILHLLTHGAMKSFLFLSAGSALQAVEGHHHGEHHAPSGQPVSWSLVKASMCALALALIPPLVIFSGPYEQLWTLSNAAQARAGFLVLGLGTVFLIGYYLCQGLVTTFASSDGKRGQPKGGGLPLLSPSLVFGFVPLTAGVAGTLVLSARGLVDFVAPALPSAASTGGLVPVASGAIFGLLAGVLAAFGGWGGALLLHLHPLRASKAWRERRKSFYVFFLNKGYFDEIYAAFIIQPFQCFAAWLWRRVDGRFIDLPANRVVHAVERVGTRLSSGLGGEQVLKPEVPFAAMRLLVVLLVFLLFVLGVAERIEIYFLE